MGIPDHLTCLPRNLYVGQEATVKLEHCVDGIRIKKKKKKKERKKGGNKQKKKKGDNGFLAGKL